MNKSKLKAGRWHTVYEPYENHRETWEIGRHAHLRIKEEPKEVIGEILSVQFMPGLTGSWNAKIRRLDNNVIITMNRMDYSLVSGSLGNF